MAYSHVFSIMALFVAALTLVDSEPRLSRTLLVAIGAAGFASLYTIRQQQKYGDLYGFRPGGMLGDANEYSLVIGLWMPLALLWAFSRRPLWERALCFGCLAASVLGTTFAASRGGFFGLAAAFVFVIWNSRNRFRNLAIVTALFVPLLFFSSSSVIERFRNPSYGDQLAEQARLITWKAGLRMIKAHPFVGVGLHNFKPMVAGYEDGEQVVSLAHNTYIELGAELGIPAVLIFLGMLVAAFGSLYRVRRHARLVGSLHLWNIAIGLQAGIISYLISAFFVSAWWQKLLWLLLFSTCCAVRMACALAARRSALQATQPVLTDIGNEESTGSVKPLQPV